MFLSNVMTKELGFKLKVVAQRVLNYKQGYKAIVNSYTHTVAAFDRRVRSVFSPNVRVPPSSCLHGYNV